MSEDKEAKTPPDGYHPEGTCEDSPKGNSQRAEDLPPGRDAASGPEAPEGLIDYTMSVLLARLRALDRMVDDCLDLVLSAVPKKKPKSGPGGGSPNSGSQG